MRNYLDLLEKIYSTGTRRQGRNGWTRALFAEQLRFDLAQGFPAVTTKKLAFKGVISELLWFLDMKNKDRANDHDLRALNASESTIWTANAESDYWKPKAQSDGDLGRIYGVQWRNWRTLDDQGQTVKRVDQVAELIDKLKNNPFDRRLLVTAWNPGELDDMALPPCHMFFQCFVDADNRLSLHMVQRSCDMFLGVPFNIASYAILTHMLAQVSGLKPGELILTLNDAHIYEDHLEAVKEQLSRSPMTLPSLWLNPDIKNLDDFKPQDFRLDNYQHHPPIKAKMAV